MFAMARQLPYRAGKGLRMRSEAKRESVFYVALVAALLLGLVACSPGGAPGGGSVAVNVTGYWVPKTSTSFYRLKQSGSEVTGEFYVTEGRVALGFADYVYECGLLGGKVDGRTLTIEVIMTPQNCPISIDAGREARNAVTGQVRNDSFSGTVNWTTFIVVGGTRQVDETGSYSTEWENVEPTDLRVQYRIDD